MQQSLLSKNELRLYKRYTHGGVSLKKRRKTKRPLVPGRITHVVFKSSKAKGQLSFYSNKQLVQRLLNERAKKFFVDVKDFVNMGNHLHLKVRFKDAVLFKNFLRTFPGLLARRLTGSNRGTKFGGRFWDGLVYTRILFTRLEELGLKIYFSGNQIERDLGYRERAEYLRQWNQYLYRLKAVRAGPLLVSES